MYGAAVDSGSVGVGVTNILPMQQCACDLWKLKQPPSVAFRGGPLEPHVAGFDSTNTK